VRVLKSLERSRQFLAWRSPLLVLGNPHADVTATIECSAGKAINMGARLRIRHDGIEHYDVLSLVMEGYAGDLELCGKSLNPRRRIPRQRPDTPGSRDDSVIIDRGCGRSGQVERVGDLRESTLLPRGPKLANSG
jgi:hypothetical protein